MDLKEMQAKLTELSARVKSDAIDRAIDAARIVPDMRDLAKGALMHRSDAEGTDVATHLEALIKSTPALVAPTPPPKGVSSASGGQGSAGQGAGDSRAPQIRQPMGLAEAVAAALQAQVDGGGGS